MSAFITIPIALLGVAAATPTQTSPKSDRSDRSVRSVRSVRPLKPPNPIDPIDPIDPLNNPNKNPKNMKTTTYTGRIGLQTFIVETSRERGWRRRYSPDAVFKMRGAPIFRHREVVSVKSRVPLPCESLAPSDLHIGPHTRSLLRRSNLVLLRVSSISAKEIKVQYMYKHLFWMKPFSLTLRASVEHEEGAEADTSSSSGNGNAVLLPLYAWL